MKPQQSMFDVLACVYRVQSSFGGEKGNTGALLENRKCLYVWICMNLFLQRACVWFRLYVRSCSVRHYSARSYVCALTNTHTESVSFQCFLVFVQLWGVVTVKNNNKIIKNLMSSQHHCSKYTKKACLYEDNGKKLHFNLTRVFFFFFCKSVIFNKNKLLFFGLFLCECSHSFS